MVSTDLLALGEAIWSWRAVTQPLSGDDIPRIERPVGWVPDWSPEAIRQRRRQLTEFDAEHAKLAPRTRDPIRDQVDWRLLGSALARVRWELDVLKGYERNPRFYVHQTVGAIFDLLLQLPPFNEELIHRAESIPSTLDAARANLGAETVAPFAKLALDALDDIGPRLATVVRELTLVLDPASAARFARAVEVGAHALEGFAEWLRARMDGMSAGAAIGRNTYVWFLKNVALIPLSPEQIVAGAQQEFERAITFETLEALRNRNLPQLPLPQSQADQIEREAAAEQQLRNFCEEQDLLSFPGWLRHYLNRPLPAYLAPLRSVGVTDDLTSARRLDEDGFHFIPPPSPDLPYFYLAMARDPRTLIAHEGVHYYQLARSWANDDPLRRYYYDSGPNEGIGFYAEEMLLQAGLFDDSPRSREIIYNMLRLRALRVIVDVRLALGELTIDSAAQHLARLVPMDAETAREEASFFASEPGQAITYQVGKLQILKFLAGARQAQRDRFSPRGFHDALLVNGNVPIALQRWEALGADDEVALL